MLQYYTDPASGYVFRSKKAVLRYLETGEIGRDAFLPKNNHSDDQNLINKDKSVSLHLASACSCYVYFHPNSIIILLAQCLPA